MRRNATKVAAVVMSLAVTMTSVNLPTTAAAATKKVKLNKTKATLTVGKTTTLKVTKGGKAVKATFKSNKPKIAKVVKKSGKSTKIKALKKGTATITATYAKKKYKCKITVKAKKVVKPTTAPTVAPTVEPTVVPTTEPSTDAALSTKENAANVKLELTNAYNDKYLDTVLVGTNANIRATVTDKNGKPVANAPVVLASKEVVPSYASGTHKEPELDDKGEIKKDSSDNIIYKDVPNVYNAASIENLTDTVVKTDENGVAVFVFGFDKVKDGLNNKTAIDAMRKDYVSSYKLTAKVAGSDVGNDAVVRFGAVTVKTTNDNSSAIIGVDNNIKSDDSIPNIVPGKNALGNGVFTTTDANGKRAEYVYSQQVSKSGSKDHAVKLSTAAYLIVPDKEDELQSNTIVETYNKGINEYGVYADKSERYVVKSTKASNLQYATVNFKDLKLSRYSKLTVEAYLCDSNADDAKLEDGQRIFVEKYNQDKVVGSDKEDITLDKWSVQIPLEDVNGEKYLHVVAKINSAGQVNDDVNDGFTVTTIEGVYKKGTANSSGVKEILDDVSISWDIDKNVTYTDLTKVPEKSDIEKALDNKESGELKANSTDKYKTYGELDYTYKYKVPAFPRTGNAIIYVYNKKNDVVAYYACTTKNDDKNRNELAYAPGNLYQLSEDEAKNQTGDITEQNATSVTVNAEKTGITNIVGTITSNNKNVEIDASNNKVYSSIHWNPIPVEAAKDTRTPAIALAGQQMKIVAQLADVNGNPVTVPNKAIDFKVDNEEVDKALKSATGVTKVSEDAKTNAKGQAELILSAEDVAELISVSAESKSKEYTVVYTLGNKLINTKFVDLYWLDFDLSFTNTAFGAPVTTSTKTADSMVVSGSAIGTATVGSNWKYGVQIDGSSFNPSNGILADHKKLTFAGITSIISNRLNSKGSYTKGVDMVNITSKEAGLSEIIFKLNKNSFAEVLTFTFKKSDDTDPIEGFYAGIGDPSINKTLNLNIQWDAYGVNGSFVLPTGRYATKDSDLKTYYKLVDKFGNPLKGEKVTFNAFKNGTDLGLKTEVLTNENGVAKFPVASAYLENGASYVVTATYDGVTTSQSYKVVAKSEESFRVTESGYDAKTKKLTLRFSDDVVSTSVLADMFSKKYDNAIIFSDGVNEHRYNVAAVEVNGTDVTFTLPDTFTESVSNDSYFKINFNTVTIDGIDYSVASDTTGEIINGRTATVTLDGVIFE